MPSFIILGYFREDAFLTPHPWAALKRAILNKVKDIHRNAFPLPLGKILIQDQNLTLHKKWIFPLRIFSVNVTQSAIFLQIWSHLLKKSLTEKFIFCAVSNQSLSQPKAWTSTQRCYYLNMRTRLSAFPVLCQILIK